MKKRIAFGWSGTLVPEVGEFRCIPPKGLGALVYKPHLRRGTLELMRELQRAGWEICIYTLGSLPRQRVSLYFALNGIRIGQVVTGKEHLRAYKQGEAPSVSFKHGPAFGFDVVVDDKEITMRAGQRYGFATVLATTRYEDWGAPIRGFCLQPAPQSEQEPLALAA